jgi:ubiquinone/menaquinone biosynthesis C-methylase UbiE
LDHGRLLASQRDDRISTEFVSKEIPYTAEPGNKEEFTERFDRSYTRFARIYDVAVRRLPVWKTWLKKALPHIEGERVLEASFGTGYLMMQYAGQHETSGVDYNARMVEIAKRNLERSGIEAHIEKANVESLPFEAEFFDTIVNTMAFSGYPDGDRAMSEFRRVLKPDGRLILMDFAYPKNGNRPGVLLTRLMEKAGDIIRDMGEILRRFDFEFTDEEIGGFGSVHLYIATKR